MPKATQKPPLRFKSCHFLAVCRVTAGDRRDEMRGPLRPIRASFIARSAHDDDGTTSFCCRGRLLQLQVVVAALTRT
jgi:hypothetical protein